MATFDSKDNQDPQAASTGEGSTHAKVAAVIDEIRPYIQADGGDVELMRVEDGVAYVRLKGACCGCPSAIYTLKAGIETRVVERVPEVKSVEAV